MNADRLKTFGYYALFWLWILLCEPFFMRATQDAVHNGTRSVLLAAFTGLAIVVEAIVWRSKVAHMRKSKHLPESPTLPVTLWIGHMLGSMIVFFVFLSSIGWSLEMLREPTLASVVILLIMMILVIKEIVFLMHLLDDDISAPRFSLEKSNGALLFAAMVMHSCFWGLISAGAAPLSSYGFAEMLLLQIPFAFVIFLISYIPSRILNTLQEYTESRALLMKGVTTIGYYLFTALLAMKAIY